MPHVEYDDSCPYCGSSSTVLFDLDNPVLKCLTCSKFFDGEEEFDEELEKDRLARKTKEEDN